MGTGLEGRAPYGDGVHTPERSPGPVQLWNIGSRPNVHGGQQPFNILGRLRVGMDPDRVRFRLNDGPWGSVYVKRPGDRVMRLQSDRDFNIDASSVEDLSSRNLLELEGRDLAGRPWGTRRRFDATSFGAGPVWDTRPTPDGHPQSLGQVVDGRWTTGSDRHGPWIGIRADDAGLDRIILFSPAIRCDHYDVMADVCVDRWTRELHNLGIVFDWTGHRVGDGSTLPPEWTTGLAYYYSHSPGIRLRLGRDVRSGPGGVRHGDVLLGERPYSRPRDVLARAVRRLPGSLVVGQFPRRTPLRMHLSVTPATYAFEVGPARHRAPVRLEVRRERPDYLPAGSCGIIAHYCAVRIHRFVVRCRCSPGGHR